MKVIIAGSRSILDKWTIVEAVGATDWIIDEVVSGGAVGVDRLGEEWAATHNIPVRQFIAEWDRYGKAAGIYRNNDMAQYADALIAVWDGKSRGTLHMINSMVTLKKPVYVYCPTCEH
jgi:hypothetical protein